LAVDDPGFGVGEEAFGEADLVGAGGAGEARSESRCMTITFIVPEARDSLNDCCIQAAMGRWENMRHDSSMTMRRVSSAPRAAWNQAATQAMTRAGRGVVLRAQVDHHQRSGGRRGGGRAVEGDGRA